MKIYINLNKYTYIYSNLYMGALNSKFKRPSISSCNYDTIHKFIFTTGANSLLFHGPTYV